MPISARHSVIGQGCFVRCRQASLCLSYGRVVQDI